MFYPRINQKSFYPQRGITAGRNTVTPMPAINSFGGNYMVTTSNQLNLPTGALLQNVNCEYGVDDKYVYMKTRRGNTMLCDITNDNLGCGLAQYSGSAYLFWIDATTGELCYTIGNSGDVVATGSIFSTDYYSDFLFYNHPIVPTIYICNKTDGVYKVDFVAAFTVSAVSGSPKISRMAFSYISGRLFGVDDQHTGYYTSIQQPTATTCAQLETWTISTQFFITAPTEGDGFRAIIDDGNTLYLFKNSGIWVLSNAGEDVANWVFPKLTINTGTESPQTVTLANYKGNNGLIFLGSDKTLRFFYGTIKRNAGTTPDFSEGESIDLSNGFQSKLNSIESAYLKKSACIIWDKNYLISFCYDSSSAISACISIDIGKGSQYWYDFENYLFTGFLKNSSTGYGFDSRGFIVTLLTDSKINDDFPSRVTGYYDDILDEDNLINQVSIRYSFYLAWIKVSDSLHRLVNGYLDIKSGGSYPVYFSSNSFTKGEGIPSFNEGLSTTFYPNASGSFWDIALWDLDKWSLENTEQSNRGIVPNNEGNYFSFGFYNNSINQTATIFSIQLNFKQLRRTPIVTN